VSWCIIHKPDFYFLAICAEICLLNLSEHVGLMSLSVCGLIMTVNVFLQEAMGLDDVWQKFPF
jgi:hypothetical protein